MQRGSQIKGKTERLYHLLLHCGSSTASTIINCQGDPELLDSGTVFCLQCTSVAPLFCTKFATDKWLVDNYFDSDLKDE